MTLRLLSLIIITLLTVACSKRITDPCVGIEPITQVNLESENILCFVSTDSYDLDYRELHERQWDPTFSHNANSDLVGDPGNKIRDFIRNLYPGSRFRFHRVDTPDAQVTPKIFPPERTIP